MKQKIVMGMCNMADAVDMAIILLCASIDPFTNGRSGRTTDEEWRCVRIAERKYTAQ